MGFHDRVYEKARNLNAHVVLPESRDVRIQKAAVKALRSGLVKSLSFIGDPDGIKSVSRRENIDISRVKIIDHLNDSNFEEFSQEYYRLRKHRGISRQEAIDTIKDPVYYAAMMVRKDYADGMVAGAVYSTAHLIRSSLKVIGMRPGIKTASSCFVIIHPDRTFGFEGHMIFADCATVPSPDFKQLAEIAIASDETGMSLIGIKPVISMLSYSTKGSAKGSLVEKVIEATEIVRQRRPDLVISRGCSVDDILGVIAITAVQAFS